MRRRKIRSGEYAGKKAILAEQKCQLCSNTQEVDEATVAFLCERCTFQLAIHTKQMPMLVSEIEECVKCGKPTNQILRTMTEDRSQIVEKFICPSCHPVVEVQDQIKEKSDRPAGWRFMKQFVDKDGTVYQLKEFVSEDGKEYTKSVEVPELKGTLPPTDVAAVKAAQKEKRKEKKKLKEERKAKKQAKLAKEYEKKKRIQDKEKAKAEEASRKSKFLEE